MHAETVFAKSPKGLEEIETRAHKLGSRLRQVLIRIDGAKTLDAHVAEAGDMGEQVLGQIEELARLGFLTDLTEAEVVEEIAEPVAAVPQPAVRAAPPPTPAAVARPAPVPVKPVLVATPAAHLPEVVEFTSPVKFRLQDLLVDAMGFETGSAGSALNRCRNRDDLARWVDLALVPIEQAAGKAKAKAFYKQAKKLVGG